MALFGLTPAEVTRRPVARCASILGAVAVAVAVLHSSSAHAADGDSSPSLLREPGLLSANGESTTLHPRSGMLLAQAEGDDAYDPFSDYSEFDESMDEEEDINFFRNGRLLTIGLIGGYRGWTQDLGKIYSGNAGFGLFLSYFFDLRFALQIGYMTSDHTIVAKGVSGTLPVQGNVNIGDLSILLKYYFNTQNVTKGLADLNPYIVGGFSQLYRTRTLSGQDSNTFSKDSAFGFDAGAGIEIPMMRNKMYFGFEALYEYVSFSDAANTIKDANDQDTGVTQQGNTFLALGILGINF
jgi:hypothetical protein